VLSRRFNFHSDCPAVGIAPTNITVAARACDTAAVPENLLQIHFSHWEITVALHGGLSHIQGPMSDAGRFCQASKTMPRKKLHHERPAGSPSLD
jgi:hypothetical protein